MRSDVSGSVTVWVGGISDAVVKSSSGRFLKSLRVFGAEGEEEVRSVKAWRVTWDVKLEMKAISLWQFAGTCACSTRTQH